MDFKRYFIAIFLSVLVLNSCSVDAIDTSLDVKSVVPSVQKERYVPSKYKTKNVIILVVDGPRYSETWGSPTRELIPVLDKQLAPLGVVNSAFYNLGSTFTNPGHTAITTGNYQDIKNNGTELPDFPSIFQHWSHTYEQDGESTYVITSKDKLEILADTNLASWNGRYKPATDCGIAGLATGYRDDAITYQHTFDILSKKHPKLVLINLRAPDSFAHANDWDNYIRGISNSDQFLGDLWRFLQDDPFYADSTTLFMTNDHGRHGNGNKNGFISHGDGCSECRHLNFFAIGPDFKRNEILTTERSQIDISATVAELLQFDMPYGKGEVMFELFAPPSETRSRTVAQNIAE